jgi:hypothetical protein
MGVRTTVIEEDLPKDELSRLTEETIEIQKRLGACCKDIAVRKFTFVRKDIKDEATLSTIQEDSFLGYAILVTVTIGAKKKRWSYIFEAVVREIESLRGSSTWICVENQYLHVKRQFRCEVGSQSYTIHGSYFRQQNSITNVCGHACICMMLNNVPDAIGIVSAEKINRCLGIDQTVTARRFRLQTIIGRETNCEAGELRGLSTKQMQSAFETEGFRTYQIRVDTLEQKRSFRAAIYGFIESRFPAFVAFNVPAGSEGEQGQHVFTVVGHTLSPHSWLSKEYNYTTRKPEYLSSLAWIDQFVIHDDNYGMQFTFPAHAFSSIEQEDPCSVEEGLGIYPKKYRIEMRSEFTTAIAADYLRALCRDSGGDVFRENDYTKRFLQSDGRSLRSDLVLRPVLIEWQRYLAQHLSNDGGDIEETRRFIDNYRNAGLEYVWLVEVTESDLFVGNQSKLVDVLLNPQFRVRKEGAEPEITEGALVLIRTPGRVLERRNSCWHELPGWIVVERHIQMFHY